MLLLLDSGHPSQPTSAPCRTSPTWPALVSMNQNMWSQGKTKKTAQVLAVLSPITAVASFFTLGNAIVIANEVLNGVGLTIALLSLVVFVISSIVLVVARIAGRARGEAGPARAKASAPAPPWYRVTKLLIGLSIILGLYVGTPAYLTWSSGHSLDALTVLLALLTILPLYALPFPYGIVVWPLTAIGVGLVLCHRRRWMVLDGFAVVLVALIVMGAYTVVNEGSRQSSQPVGGIGGPETVQITASNGEGGGTWGVGVCISAGIPVPRDGAPDVTCSVTDAGGRTAFKVKPGKYYIYLDLRSRDEFNFDPKFPVERMEWEVLPQSTNEIELLITPKR